MLVYRVEKNKYRKVYPPEGSKFAYGRWSTRDMWVVYTSESIALAKLETLANTGSQIPRERFVRTLEVDNSAPLVEVTIEQLPTNWTSVSYPKKLVKIVKDIMQEGEYVGAIVPSVQSPRESNILLFPEHPNFNRFIQKVDDSAEDFDPRLK